MKCIKKEGVIKRVKDDVAKIAVEENGWKYCPKSEWKEKVRDAGKLSKSQQKRLDVQTADDQNIN